MMTAQQAFVNTREGDAFRFLGIPTVMRATGETTNGGFGLVEHLEMPVGFASPYHTHHREDEAFYVLEGEVAFVCDGKWQRGGAGTFVFGPREIPHGFKVVGDRAARMLLWCAPGGFERFVLEQREPMEGAGPVDMGRLMALAAKYGIDVHGPLPEEELGAASGQSDREQIEAIRAAHVEALNAGDAARLAGLFAADAVQMPPGAPVNVGRAQIEGWLAGFLGMFRVEFALMPGELEICGDRAIESGGYRLGVMPAGGGRMEEVGKYITVYGKRGGGGWAVVKDIWNRD